MTPISEQKLSKPKELGTQQAATTSHNSPAAPPNEKDVENADDQDEQQQQAARRQRDFLLAGIRKLIMSFKSLSHIFEIYKEEEEEDEEEEDDMDGGIEIGFPTDVRHVAHIGLDGSTSVSSSNLRGGLSLSNLTTLEQFQLAMASLAAAPGKERDHGVVDRASRD